MRIKDASQDMGEGQIFSTWIMDLSEKETVEVLATSSMVIHVFRALSPWFRKA